MFLYDRRHVKYYGGYHSQHKVIVWLWEVVKNDLNREEKAAFLKVCVYGYICTIQCVYVCVCIYLDHTYFTG